MGSQQQMSAMTKKLGESQEAWAEGMRNEVSGVTQVITDNMSQLTGELSSHVESELQHAIDREFG